MQKCHNTMTYLQYPPLPHTNPSHLCIQQPPLPESPCILPLQNPKHLRSKLGKMAQNDATLPRRAPPWSTDDAGPAWWDHSDIKQGSILRIYNSSCIKKKALIQLCVYFGCFGGCFNLPDSDNIFWLIEHNLYPGNQNKNHSKGYQPKTRGNRKRVLMSMDRGNTIRLVSEHVRHCGMHIRIINGIMTQSSCQVSPLNGDHWWLLQWLHPLSGIWTAYSGLIWIYCLMRRKEAFCGPNFLILKGAFLDTPQ